MRAIEHFQEANAYIREAANEERVEPALLCALLAIAEALQALTLSYVLEEHQNPHYMEQWRLEWQESPSPPAT